MIQNNSNIGSIQSLGLSFIVIGTAIGAAVISPIVYTNNSNSQWHVDCTSYGALPYNSFEKDYGLKLDGTGEVIDLLQQSNLDKIQKMSEFEVDWDGYGATPFTDASIALFRDVITHLNQQPLIAPTGRNSLYMQYSKDNKSVLAFELGENSLEKVYVPNGDFSRAESKTFKSNYYKVINESVESFYEQ